MARQFTRRIEDFTCEQCGDDVRGSGFTNHCPKCLWSKHVDVNPGDREASCGGMMEPIRIEQKGKEERIMYRCTVCSYERYNIVTSRDSRKALIKLAEN